MTDRYSDFINTPIGKKLAGALGLPAPVPLERYNPAEPQVPGMIMAIGESAAFEQVVADLVAEHVDVRRNLAPRDRPHAVLIGVDHATTVEELEHGLMQAQAAVKSVARNGRVIVISKHPELATGIEEHAVAVGVTGFVRSLAHELRAGATANGVQLTAQPSSGELTALTQAVRFFLSKRSVFVSGQFLPVDPNQTGATVDRVHPLAGKVALVTGAARGIGAEIARTLSRDGATVVGIDIPAAGDALASVCNEIGGLAVQVDITAMDAPEKIFAALKQRGLKADIVVHNAGITRDKLFVNMDAMQFNSVLEVNLAAQLRFNKAFLGSDVQGDAPRMVTLSSTSGIAGNRGQTNYAVSKAGVIGLVESSAADFAAAGGSINAVAPGFIETEMTSRIPFATREVARRLNSLQQGGKPEDVAEVIAFLVSDAAAGVNGQTLRVCGQNLVGA
ncbi:3-oxoacyl-ACP reductase [Micrococcoides hystricis]|uniref:3-oxoacyl-ACP reductase n=1 Tax=Micrococcoides hystricis TaxID=1572761 RepID=A0ABV6P7D8_9MICC